MRIFYFNPRRYDWPTPVQMICRQRGETETQSTSYHVKMYYGKNG